MTNHEAAESRTPRKNKNITYSSSRRIGKTVSKISNNSCHGNPAINSSQINKNQKTKRNTKQT